ncbi:PAS domain S-box-containing protein [Anaerosolibacter carboniphilus]|uniref:histidine kinase n=1 Tax=Anaerosolibacter carboniphilus TaxID=1417629 RepID=A0A841KWC3_9FIRM|nr:ATP-binding protein [Anaerosolibacter carboniphilus]MBB6215222.1 PAS domain S-box-containing protein [Anaerosolibacter carboniphilus]
MNTRQKYKGFIVFSVLIITLLHYVTGSSIWGFHDFYRRLYYIPIILAAFQFGLRGAMLTALSIIALYAPHLLIYFGRVNIEVINQMLEASMFIIIGMITGALVESESRVRRLLEIQITKLTDLENYTQNILDSILNGVVAIDREMKISSVNREGAKLLRIEDQQNATYIYDYFEDGEEVKELILKAMVQEDNVSAYETTSLKEHPGKQTIRIHGYPLRNILNRVAGMVIILEDITELKRLEGQIRRVDKLSAVGELASGIAHEIRNPLGIIKTISQTINKDIEDEDIREGLEIIEIEINRANKVIQELLDFAKPSVFNYKNQSIDQLIKDVIRITNKYAEQHRVRIHYKREEDVFVFLDADKLKQAFVNVILNAIQAMNEGGNLCVELQDKDCWVKISFIDEGKGIEQERLEKIFEPFYTTKEKGTGLGLAIAHRIIEEHKGYMEIESEIGAGTRLDIFMPRHLEGGHEKDEENTDC